MSDSLCSRRAGLCCVQDIPPGTLLISEPPVLTVTLMDGELSQGASKDVSRQFSALVEGERRVVMSLANSYEDSNEAGPAYVMRQCAQRHFYVYMHHWTIESTLE